MDPEKSEQSTTDDQGKAAPEVHQDKPKSKKRFPLWVFGLLLIMLSFLWVITQLQQLLK